MYVDSFHFCKKSIVRAEKKVVNNNLKNYLYSSICIEIINNDKKNLKQRCDFFSPLQLFMRRYIDCYFVE